MNTNPNSIGINEPFFTAVDEMPSAMPKPMPKPFVPLDRGGKINTARLNDKELAQTLNDPNQYKDLATSDIAAVLINDATQRFKSLFSSKKEAQEAPEFEEHSFPQMTADQFDEVASSNCRSQTIPDLLKGFPEWLILKNPITGNDEIAVILEDEKDNAFLEFAGNLDDRYWLSSIAKRIPEAKDILIAMKHSDSDDDNIIRGITPDYLSSLKPNIKKLYGEMIKRLADAGVKNALKLVQSLSLKAVSLLPDSNSAHSLAKTVIMGMDR
jgi:hypothetical protein